MEPMIIVHGGAGDIPDSRVEATLTGIRKAALAGYDVLKKQGKAIDAVEASINYMEKDDTFNAGYGSVLNLDGEVEMDASIMIGETLSAGAVTVIRDIPHPISLARLVMEKSPHVLLAGVGANKFAEMQGVSKLAEGALVTQYALDDLDNFKRSGKKYGELGTVGAVALDNQGHLSAGTSTGGLTGKLPGRSSDVSMIGCGTYADDNIAAVSSTGHGESITKLCLAHSIVKEIEYGKTADEATNFCLKQMQDRLKNTAGAICISKKGEIGMGYTTSKMAYAYVKDGYLYYGVDNNTKHTCI